MWLMKQAVWDAGLFNVTQHTVQEARADPGHEAEPDQMMIRTEGVHLLALCAFSHPSQLPIFEHNTQQEAELSQKAQTTASALCMLLNAHCYRTALL